MEMSRDKIDQRMERLRGLNADTLRFRLGVEVNEILQQGEMSPGAQVEVVSLILSIMKYDGNPMTGDPTVDEFVTHYINFVIKTGREEEYKEAQEGCVDIWEE